MDEFIPQKALHQALSDKLDIEVRRERIDLGAISFQCLVPPAAIAGVFKKAWKAKLSWPEGIPLSVVTWHKVKREFRIMDGMMRICAAKNAGYRQVPALVASGETLEALEPILKAGYNGEDFVEMLAMVSPEVLETIEIRDRMRMSGK